MFLPGSSQGYGEPDGDNNSKQPCASYILGKLLIFLFEPLTRKDYG